jgi:integrase
LALQSKTNPDAPQALRNFGIRVNPIASISALSKYNRPRERVLSVEELSRFFKRLLALPDGVKRDALLLVLYLGGQRPAQLLRARVVDLDLSAKTLTLYDPKGARTQPRTHVLPLTRSALDILERLAKRAANFATDARGRSQPLFSSTGTQLLRIETVSAQVTDLARAMLEAGELRERFELRDLRRSAETMLAGLGVSKDTRAQLQSHGLGGVQSRHYDRYSYLSEKRSALEVWERHLEPLLNP